jgi:hypothetical protein
MVMRYTSKSRLAADPPSTARRFTGPPRYFRWVSPCEKSPRTTGAAVFSSEGSMEPKPEGPVRDRAYGGTRASAFLRRIRSPSREVMRRAKVIWGPRSVSFTMPTAICHGSPSARRTASSTQ